MARAILIVLDSVGIGGAADQQRRRRPFGLGMAADTRVPEIAIAETERAQREHLEEPVENDGDATEHNRRLAARLDEKEGIVEHNERHGQNRRHAQDVQCVRQRNEAPFRCRQIEDEANDNAECDKEWQQE